MNEPGQAHELTFSCYRRFPFFSRVCVCQWLVKSIEEARTSLNFGVWDWMFTPDHLHLVVHPRHSRYDMAVIRRRIKEPVAKQALAWIRANAPEWLAILRRERGWRTEHLFWQSGGGYDRNITEGPTLLKMIDYLHENPAWKGLVGRSVDWRWSSVAWFVQQVEVPLAPDRIPPEWLMDARLGP